MSATAAVVVRPEPSRDEVVTVLRNFRQTWETTNDEGHLALVAPRDIPEDQRSTRRWLNNSLVQKVLLRGLDACYLALELERFGLLKVTAFTTHTPPWFMLSASSSSSSQRLTTDNEKEVNRRLAGLHIVNDSDGTWMLCIRAGTKPPPSSSSHVNNVLLWLVVRVMEPQRHRRSLFLFRPDVPLNVPLTIDTDDTLTKDSSDAMGRNRLTIYIASDTLLPELLDLKFESKPVSVSSGSRRTSMPASSSSSSSPNHPPPLAGVRRRRRRDDSDADSDDDDDDDDDGSTPKRQQPRHSKDTMEVEEARRVPDSSYASGFHPVNDAEAAMDDEEAAEITRVEEAAMATKRPTILESTEKRGAHNDGNDEARHFNGYELTYWVTDGRPATAVHRYKTLERYLTTNRKIGPYVNVSPPGTESYRLFRLPRSKQYGVFVYFLRGGENGVVAFDENGKEGYTLLINKPVTGEGTYYFIYSPYRQFQYTAPVSPSNTRPLPPLPTHYGHGLMWELLYGKDNRMQWRDEHIRDEIAARLVYIAGQKVALRTCKSFVETWALRKKRKTFDVQGVLDAPRTGSDVPRSVVKMAATRKIQNLLLRGLDACYIAVRLITMGLLTVTSHYVRESDRNPRHQFYTLSTPASDREITAKWTLSEETVKDINQRLADIRIVRHTKLYQWDLYIQANDGGTAGNSNVWVIASPFLYDERYVLYIWREDNWAPTQLTFKEDDLTLTDDRYQAVNDAFRGISRKEVPNRIHWNIERGEEVPQMHSMRRSDTSKQQNTPQFTAVGVKDTTSDELEPSTERRWHNVTGDAHAPPQLSPRAMRGATEGIPEMRRDILTTGMTTSVARDA